ncbi:DegV family protein [Virgibacillus sp. W0430]|uniref:DegV family protein n=1 Tax=Virgibacillus sp. W0430 TaxID=3391580 RepID=UPI003F485662
MKVAVVTDSTAYVPTELREKYDIHMIPLSVVFGSSAYREEQDISTEEFYAKVKNTEQLPTTSQPSVGAFVELYEALAKKGYEAIVSIHLSSKFSGTYNAAKSAGEMVDTIAVHAFDTKLSAMAQGFFALKAAELVCQNKSAHEVINNLEAMRSNVRAYFMVDDLSHLQRGGRLSGAQALVGSLLKVKPILHIVEGEIVPFEKIRTRKKALQRIIDMLEEDAEKGNVRQVVFIHGNDEPSALALRDTFAAKYPSIDTVISYFGPVIGTHLGEGSLGVSWYTEA